MMASLAELIAEHGRARTERERARIETEIWLDHGRHKPNKTKHFRMEYLRELLSVSQYHAAQRQRLLGYGDCAAALWERVEGDMSLKTAVELAYRAVRSRSRTETDEQAVCRVLAAYDTLPVTVRGKDNKVFKKTTAWIGATRDVRATEPAPSRAKTPEGKFWAAMRQLIRSHIKERLAGQTETAILGEAERFETELKVLFGEFTQRMSHKQRSTPLAVAVTRRALVDACRILHIDPPKASAAPGGAYFKTARRRFRELARQFHPDTHGSDATSEKFQAVMDAWSIVENYEEHLRQSKPAHQKENE